MMKFWMVARVDGNDPHRIPREHAPTKKHLSREAAVAESERLATQARGAAFVVLEAMGSSKIPMPQAKFTPIHSEWD